MSHRDAHLTPQERMLLDLKVDDLKSIMRAFGITLTGKKAELVARIRASFDDPTFGPRLRASCVTRWEERQKNLKALRFGALDVYDAELCALV